MKNKIQIFILLVLLIAGYSCSNEFLKEEHPTKATSGKFFLNDEQAMEALLSIYGYRTTSTATSFASDFYGRHGDGIITTWDMMRGDDFIPPKDGSTAIETYLQLNYHEESSMVAQTWQYLYLRIYRTNWVIDNVKNNQNLTDPVKNKILGEAYFMRGFFYFHLTRFFDEVPLILTSTTLGEDQFPVKKSNTECWNQVIADMEESLKYLPNPTANKVDGRVNKGVANAMLARVYLTRTRPGNKMYWDMVKKYTEDVDALGVYNLEPIDNLGEIYVYTKKGKWVKNAEMIWGIGFAYGPYDGQGFRYEDASNMGSNTTTPRVGRYVNEYNSSVPANQRITGTTFAHLILNDMGKEYSPGDGRNPGPRYAASVGLSDIMLGYAELGDKRTSEFLWYPTINVYNAGKIDPATGKFISLIQIDAKERYMKAKNNENGGEFLHLSKYKLREFVGTNIWDGGWHHSLFFPIIKYDDVVLMRAEAEYHLNGAAAAKPFLKKITDRAGFAANYLDAFSGENFLTELLKQRRVELMGEGLRVPDLIRLDLFKPPYVGTYPGSVVWSEKYKVLPIPQRELDWNRNLVQHPLWR